MRLRGIMLVLTAAILITHGDAARWPKRPSFKQSLLSNSAEKSTQKDTENDIGLMLRLKELLRTMRNIIFYPKVAKMEAIMKELVYLETEVKVVRDVTGYFKNWFANLPDPDKEFYIANIWSRMQHDGDIHLFKSLFDAIGIDEQQLKAFTDNIRDVPVKPAEAT